MQPPLERLLWNKVFAEIIKYSKATFDGENLAKVSKLHSLNPWFCCHPEMLRSIINGVKITYQTKLTSSLTPASKLLRKGSCSPSELSKFAKDHFHISIESEFSNFKSSQLMKNMQDSSASNNVMQETQMAIELLALYAPNHLVRLIQNLKWIIPIWSASEKFPTAFTECDLPKAACISRQGSSLKMAETLVHEGLHSELYIIDKYNPIMNYNYTSSQAYSPWRKTPRPAYLVFHGIYVFSGILSLYITLMKTGFYHPDVNYRYNLILSELESAIKSFPNETLSNVGYNLLHKINTQIQENKNKILQGNQEQVAIVANLELWRT